MWHACGIVRRRDAMHSALMEVAQLYVEVQQMRKQVGVSTELVELVNLATVGELVLSSALARKESRGLHYCLDYPQTSDDELRPTVIDRELKQRMDLNPIKRRLRAQEATWELARCTRGHQTMRDLPPWRGIPKTGRLAWPPSRRVRRPG